MIQGKSDEIGVKVFAMTQTEIECHPRGIISLDRQGYVKQYNRAEANLTRTTAAAAIGKHFFRDVAPCTAVQEFEGRFGEFTKHTDTAMEKFNFRFLFSWGARNVTVTLVRKAGAETICMLVSLRDDG